MNIELTGLFLLLLLMGGAKSMRRGQPHQKESNTTADGCAADFKVKPEELARVRRKDEWLSPPVVDAYLEWITRTSNEWDKSLSPRMAFVPSATLRMLADNAVPVEAKHATIRVLANAMDWSRIQLLFVPTFWNSTSTDSQRLFWHWSIAVYITDPDWRRQIVMLHSSDANAYIKEKAEFRAEVLELLKNIHFAQNRLFVKPTENEELNFAQVTEENENDSGIFTLMYAYFIGKTSKYPKSNFDVPFSPVAFRIKIYEDLNEHQGLEKIMKLLLAINRVQQQMKMTVPNIEFPTKGKFRMYKVDTIITKFYNMHIRLLKNEKNMTKYQLDTKDKIVAYQQKCFREIYDKSHNNQYHIGTIENEPGANDGIGQVMNFNIGQKNKGTLAAEFSQWVAGTSNAGTGTNNVVTSASQRMTAKSHKNFYKFTQDEIVDYFSLFDTHNDFDVEHFKQLGLDHFKYTEVVKEPKKQRGRPNQQNQRETFVMRKFLAAFLKFLNESPTEWLYINLLKNIVHHCEAQLPKEVEESKNADNKNAENENSDNKNEDILCMLFHLFTFAVEFHAQSLEFKPFENQVTKQMENFTSYQLGTRIERENRIFTPLLGWLRMKARASWMEDAAMSILAVNAFVRTKPFHLGNSEKVTAKSKARKRFNELRRSYTNLAKMVICSVSIPNLP